MSLQVYIPSRSRFDRSLTLEALQGVNWPEVYLVVPLKQVPQYKALAARMKVKLLGCAKDGISLTRQFIGQHARDKFLMLDDDLRFFHRPRFISAPQGNVPNEKAQLFKNDPTQMRQMLIMVEKRLDSYVHVAISARQGNNQLPWPMEVNNRPLRALAYRKAAFLGCKHGRTQIMEDFDVTLQLIGKGHSNAIITCFAQDQQQTQLPGGCSDYRTHELHETNVKKLAQLHAPFVTVRSKSNKTGGEFGTRTEATIYWKKLHASVIKESIG